MRRFILILFLLMSLGNAIDNHEDIVYMIHNDSCIETANYLYIFYNSPDNETFIKENLTIWVENITELGEKSIFADIYFID